MSTLPLGLSLLAGTSPHVHLPFRAQPPCLHITPCLVRDPASLLTHHLMSTSPSGLSLLAGILPHVWFGAQRPCWHIALCPLPSGLSLLAGTSPCVWIRAQRPCKLPHVHPPLWGSTSLLAHRPMSSSGPNILASTSPHVHLLVGTSLRVWF